MDGVLAEICRAYRKWFCPLRLRSLTKNALLY